MSRTEGDRERPGHALLAGLEACTSAPCTISCFLAVHCAKLDKEAVGHGWVRSDAAIGGTPAMRADAAGLYQTSYRDSGGANRTQDEANGAEVSGGGKQFSLARL